MSRKTLLLDDGRLLVVGHDHPFNTVFATLYDDRVFPRESDTPVKALGYHPSEQAIAPPGTEYGPYPADIGDLDRALIEWGIDDRTRERVGRLLAAGDVEDETYNQEG